MVRLRKKPTRRPPWVGLDVRFLTDGYRPDSFTRSPVRGPQQQQQSQQAGIELEAVHVISSEILYRREQFALRAVIPR